MPALIVKIKGRWQPKPGQPKLTRGHINRAINYGLEHKPGEDRPRVLGGQGFDYGITDDESARRAGRDMEALSDLNPSAPGPRPNPLHHMILSWRHDDNPADEHMMETGRNALQTLGMDRAKSIFIRHMDTAHHHLHMFSSRIDPETGTTFTSLKGINHDRPRMRSFARIYERERERQRELERIPERSLANDNHPWMAPLQQLWRQNATEFAAKDDRTKSIERALDRQEMQGQFRQWNENLRNHDLEREQRSRDIENQRLHDPGYGYSNADDAMRARRGKALENSRDVVGQSADPEWRRITEGQERARDLQHPDNFDEFAAARGLGRLDPREAEKIKNDHANERMLSDFDYFSKLDRDKPERTPALEHQNENTEGMPFYSPMGAKVVNRWADLDEIKHQRQQMNEMEPIEKIALKKDIRERGMGREMDIFGFDDGSSRGESGYGGD